MFKTKRTGYDPMSPIKQKGLPPVKKKQKSWKKTSPGVTNDFSFSRLRYEKQNALSEQVCYRRRKCSVGFQIRYKQNIWPNTAVEIVYVRRIEAAIATSNCRAA